MQDYYMRSLIFISLVSLTLLGCAQPGFEYPERSTVKEYFEKTRGEEYARTGVVSADAWKAKDKREGRLRPSAPSPAPLSETAMQFKNDTLSESFEAYVDKHGRCANLGRLPGYEMFACHELSTIAGVRATLSYVFVCDDVSARENCYLYQVVAGFDSTEFAMVADAMKIKYGPPESRTTSIKENRMGAEFASRKRVWLIGDTQIVVEERADKVDDGSAIYTYQPLAIKAEEGRIKSLQPDDL